jgi:hypothetical protein
MRVASCLLYGYLNLWMVVLIGVCKLFKWWLYVSCLLCGCQFTLWMPVYFMDV